MGVDWLPWSMILISRTHNRFVCLHDFTIDFKQELGETRLCPTRQIDEHGCVSKNWATGNEKRGAIMRRSFPTITQWETGEKRHLS